MLQQIIVERDDFGGEYDTLFKNLGMKNTVTGVHSDTYGVVKNEVWVKS